MLNKRTLVIGGCRSGKSKTALELAEKHVSDKKKIFIATCIPTDTEMENRVEKHKKERDGSWQTLEVPVHLAKAVIENSHKAGVILIDCITLWMNNILMKTQSCETITGHVQGLVKALDRAVCPVIMVSNEVGAGIVPENNLARLFRDYAGFANQSLAGCSENVIWMVAGIPVKIKRQK